MKKYVLLSSSITMLLITTAFVGLAIHLELLFDWTNRIIIGVTTLGGYGLSAIGFVGYRQYFKNPE